VTCCSTLPLLTTLPCFIAVTLPEITFLASLLSRVHLTCLGLAPSLTDPNGLGRKRTGRPTFAHHSDRLRSYDVGTEFRCFPLRRVVFILMPFHLPSRSRVLSGSVPGNHPPPLLFTPFYRLVSSTHDYIPSSFSSASNPQKRIIAGRWSPPHPLQPHTKDFQQSPTPLHFHILLTFEDFLMHRDSFPLALVPSYCD